MCVFNRTENNNLQATVMIHVDDVMISCCNDRNVDLVIYKIEKLCPGLAKHRRKVLYYVGMTFIFETAGQVKISQRAGRRPLRDFRGGTNTVYAGFVYG